MAAQITVVQATRDGVAPPSEVDGTSDMEIPSNDGNVILVARNPSGSDASISFIPAATVLGVALATVTRTVPAGETRLLGPWPPVIYNDETDAVAVSAATSLKLYGLRI